MGLNLCCPAMSDGEIRNKIKRKQSDTPHMKIQRACDHIAPVTTPPPGARFFPMTIPTMKGYFQIVNKTGEMREENLDLD